MKCHTLREITLNKIKLKFFILKYSFDGTSPSQWIPFQNNLHLNSFEYPFF